jgi:enoyl-CoA hydratase/carnithine racemase
MNRVCCGAVRSFRGNHPLKVVVITVRTTTFSAGFGTKDIMEA